MAIIIGQPSTRADSPPTLKWPAYSLGGYAYSSPAVEAEPNGAVYIGAIKRSSSAGYVFAINQRDGSSKWARNPVELPGWVTSSPTIGPDGTVYVGCYDGNVYALNGSDGSVRWTCYTHGAPVVSSGALSADGSTLYIGAGAFALQAIDTATGKEKWSFPTGNFVDSTPAIAADGTIYFGCDDNNVYALTPDAQEKYPPFTTGAPVVSSPAIGADGTIYVGSHDQKLYALNPDLTRKWAFTSNGPIDTSPVIGADGAIYVGSADTHLYALNPNDGTVKWSPRIGTTGQSAAAVRADGTIILQTDDGHVHAHKSDGTLLWEFDPKSGDPGSGGEIVSSPVIAPSDGAIYVGSLDGHLYALSGNGAPLSTFSSWPMLGHDARHTGRSVLYGTNSRLVNLSTRAQVDANQEVIEGFALSGPGPWVLLLRGVGPSLAQFGVPNPLVDPVLTLFDRNGQIGQNDNWEQQAAATFGIAATAAASGAFPLLPQSKDSALVSVLQPGSYSAVVRTADGSSGVALVETYDVRSSLDPATHLVNLSTRGTVGTGERVLIGGLALTGSSRTRLLVRGIGPGLTQFGVAGVLARPQLTIVDAKQNQVAQNAGWTAGASALAKGDTAGAAVTAGAFALDEKSADAAVIVTLDAGAYTIEVAGVGGTTGVALVEVYLLR